MKYMHFKASCAYTALAEMAEANGIHTEDNQIALEMKLPWLFAKEDGGYVSGPMLQGARWFNLWLIPRGYRMTEASLDRESLGPYLQAHCPSMLGIQTPYGKHAVVYKEYDGNYHFFNPTHKGSGESTELIFCEGDLLSMVDETTVVGELHVTEPSSQDIAPLLTASISVIHENCAEIEAFASIIHHPDTYWPMMNKLFRPLLLDGITMLEFAGEAELARAFSSIQQDFLAFMRGPRTEEMEKRLPLKELHRRAEEYVRLIERQLQ